MSQDMVAKQLSVSGSIYGNELGYNSAQAEQPSAETVARHQRCMATRNVTNELYSSGSRINQALEQITRGAEPTALLKSDIDNAIRHCVSMTKNLRAVKATLFPTSEKEKVVEGNGQTPTQITKDVGAPGIN